MISVEQVTKTYYRGRNRVEAVRGLDLEIPGGAFSVIMGPSGSGKSTLLHLIGCLDSPTTGEIRFAGTRLSLLSSDQRAQVRGRRIGFVFQRFNQIANLSAQENVELPMLLAGDPRRRARRRAKDMLSWVGLDHRASHRPSELSGGELQRVAIARALANDPDAILADEPTGNLDASTGDHVIALLRKLRDEGKTCVIVTHNLELVSAGDLPVHIRDGVRVDSLVRERQEVRS